MNRNVFCNHFQITVQTEGTFYRQKYYKQMFLCWFQMVMSVIKSFFVVAVAYEIAITDKIFFSKQHFMYNSFLHQPNQSIDSKSFQNPYTSTYNPLETTHITRWMSYGCQNTICTYYKNSVYWISLSPVGILYHLNSSQLAKQFK